MKAKHKHTIAAVCLGLVLSIGGCKSKSEAPPLDTSKNAIQTRCDFHPYESIAKELATRSGSSLPQSDINELSARLIAHSPVDVYPTRSLADVFSYICIIEPRVDAIDSPIYLGIPIRGATGNRIYYLVASTGRNLNDPNIKIKNLGDFPANDYEVKLVKNGIAIIAKTHISLRKYSVDVYTVYSLRMSRSDSWIEEYDEDSPGGPRIMKLK